MSKLFVADTNIILDDIESLQDYNIVLLSHTLRELEKHKSNRRDAELAYKARKATRYIKENKDKFHFDLNDYDGSPHGDNSYEDNRILAAIVENQYGLISNDVLMTFRAEGLGVEVVELNDSHKDSNSDYTGIHKLYLSDSVEDQEKLANLYEGNLEINLLTNQYLIVYMNGKVIDKFRYDGEKLVKLKLPPQHVIKARNEEQECALDLLNNKNIPIRFIIGTYGSGKTLLNVKMALHKVIDKGEHAKIMVIRNPLGSGEAIGWLKGTKEDKTQDFFKPFVQHLQGGEQEAIYLEQRGQLIKEIPYYIKGLDIQDTFIMVDEAEDLDQKLLKLVGTRLSENSVVSFVGDFKQAEDKFIHQNGLKIAVEKLKGHPLVGVVSLSEDIRSEASKVFAEM